MTAHDDDDVYTRPPSTDTRLGAERWLLNNGWKEDGITVRLKVASDLMRLRRLADAQRGDEDGRRR